MSAWVTYYLEGASNQGPKKKAAKDEGPLATLGVRPIGADGTPGKTVILPAKPSPSAESPSPRWPPTSSLKPRSPGSRAKRANPTSSSPRSAPTAPSSLKKA